PVKRASQKPVGSGRLVPVKPGGEQPVSKWNPYRSGNVDGADPGNHAGRREARQCVELIHAELAVGNACILVYVLERREEPGASFLTGSASIESPVAAREWLFGIRFWIVQLVPRIERTAPVVECSPSMPLVVAAPGADDHRAAVGSRGVGVELRRSDGEVVDGIRRVVLKETANVIVVVVAAVDR